MLIEYIEERIRNFLLEDDSTLVSIDYERDLLLFSRKGIISIMGLRDIYCKIKVS